ncbi:MAG: hypothetical protein IPL70_07265 [Uliginosibacterium sp.]|nr:hypothetical protein [Uliginosibacterium sp.]
MRHQGAGALQECFAFNGLAALPGAQEQKGRKVVDDVDECFAIHVAGSRLQTRAS